MKKVNVLPRISALFLTLALAIPSPAMALRVQTGTESSALTGLEEALKPAAGLEEAGSIDRHVRQAGNFMAAGKYADAEAEWTAAISLRGENNPGSAPFYLRRSEARSRQRKFAEEAQDLTRVIGFNGENSLRSVAVYVMRAKALRMLGLYGEAEADARKALELDPRSIGAHRALARAYEGQRDFRKAWAAWTEASRLPGFRVPEPGRFTLSFGESMPLPIGRSVTLTAVNEPVWNEKNGAPKGGKLLYIADPENTVLLLLEDLLRQDPGGSESTGWMRRMLAEFLGKSKGGRFTFIPRPGNTLYILSASEVRDFLAGPSSDVPLTADLLRQSALTLKVLNRGESHLQSSLAFPSRVLPLPGRSRPLAAPTAGLEEIPAVQVLGDTVGLVRLVTVPVSEERIGGGSSFPAVASRPEDIVGVRTSLYVGDAEHKTLWHPKVPDPKEFWRQSVERHRQLVDLFRRNPNSALTNLITDINQILSSVAKDSPVAQPPPPAAPRAYRPEGPEAGLEEGSAERFAERAGESSVFVVLAQTAFQRVKGLRQAVEALEKTRLRQHLIFLPASPIPEELVEIVTQVSGTKDPSFAVYADEKDEAAERFERVATAAAIPYRRERPEELAPLVRQILLNLGVPEGVATQAAVERFLAAAGLEEGA